MQAATRTRAICPACSARDRNSSSVSPSKRRERESMVDRKDKQSRHYARSKGIATSSRHGRRSDLGVSSQLTSKAVIRREKPIALVAQKLFVGDDPGRE